MTWGSNCPNHCGHDDCSWAFGEHCEGRVRNKITAQREECAKIADKWATEWRNSAENLLSGGQRDPAMRYAARAEAAEKIAQAIRGSQK
jgi:hypothetical protein